jgi:hypothetical protein
LTDIIMSGIYWYDIDVKHFYCLEGKHEKPFVHIILIAFRVGP